MNTLLGLLFTAGGAAFLTAIVAGIRSLRTSRVESEEALIKRLNDDAVNARKEAESQRRRAERAERQLDKMRDERDAAEELSARRHYALIRAGITDVD